LELEHFKEAAMTDPGSPILAALYQQKPDEAERLAEGAALTIWEAAALGRDARVAELLRADPAIANAWAADGFTPVALAAFFGHESTARTLLDAGANVHAVARHVMNVQPLHAAVAARNIAIVQLLLDRGADANARQQVGYTPLMGAAGAGREDMVSLLLAHGADPALASEDGKTAAGLALEQVHAAIAELLAATVSKDGAKRPGLRGPSA
jgi:ankyrin repeat protein